MDKHILTKWTEFRDWCRGDISTLALDFECTNASYLGLQVAGWSACNGESLCYVDVLDNPQYQILCNQLAHILRDKVKCLIMHNAPFDMRILKQLDIQHTDNIFCTMTAAHLLNENTPKGLKWQTVHVLKQTRETLNFSDAISEGFHSRKFYEYATDDAVNTFDLYKLQVPQLKKQELWDLWYNIERPFQYCLRDLAINGVLVDKVNLVAAQEQTTQDVNELEIEMYKSAGVSYYTQMLLDGGYEIIPKVNLNSPLQLIDLLQHLGVTLKETTDGGQLSTKEAVLVSVRRQHPFVGLLLKYRTISKMLNGFLIPLPKFIQADSRIRGSFHNCVAVTGRLSCTKPSLQCLPK